MHRFLALFLGVLLLPALPAAGQFDDLFGGDTAGDDLLGELESEIVGDDFDQLRHSHLSSVRRWHGVAGPRDPVTGKPGERPPAWRASDETWAQPLGPEEIQTQIVVPAEGRYRLWVRYRGDRGRKHPFELSLRGANDGRHMFHTRPLSARPGHEQEKGGPVRFEEEFQRLGVPAVDAPVWEFWDVQLAAGATTLALRSDDPAAAVDCIFFTQSKQFIPGKGKDISRGVVDRTWYRVRVTEGAAVDQPIEVPAERVTYHWRWVQRGNSEPTWYASLSDAARFPAAGGGSTLLAGQWSAFIDTTYACSAPGPWATGYLTFPNLPEGQIELQLAWYPHEAAVLKTLTLGVMGGRAVWLFPLDGANVDGAVAAVDPAQDEGAATAAWGMRDRDYLDWLQSPQEVYERQAALAREAIAAAPQPANTLPHHLRLVSGNSAAPAVRADTARMLATLGINVIDGTPAALAEELGLHHERRIAMADALYGAKTHCPTDPRIEEKFYSVFEARVQAQAPEAREAYRASVTTLKMGDEIGAIVPIRHVNACSDCLAAFHDYLHGQLEAAGQDAGYLGVSDVSLLPMLESLPDRPGIFERRLYYHSSRYRFVMTADFYRRMTAAAERVFPNVRSYCNFSPHPPMFGGTMNSSDWFVLTRRGGASMAWGEDWAGLAGSWSMAGVQTVGYYGALVAAAARVQGRPPLPAGFYNVTSMSGVARKMFCLLAQGINYQVIYSFGPRYAGAEGSNFWDESPRAYKGLAQASRAIGPADVIVARGQRSPSHVALLYNRSHEIWQGAEGGYQTDRLLTFIALRQVHRNVDIVLEEDLTAEALAPYRVLYLQGHNLATRHLEAVRDWVARGGTLVAVAGTAMFDEYNSPQPAAEALFGARQTVTGMSSGSWHALNIPKHEPIDELTLDASALTVALTAPVVGTKVVLEPLPDAGLTVVGRFHDGSAGAVLRTIGKGQVLLLGVQPGLMFKGAAEGSNQYTDRLRPLVVAPAEKTLPAPEARHSDPRVEATLFSHESGLAVVLTDCSLEPGRPGNLTVAVDRPIGDVISTVRGPLAFRSEQGRIIIDCPVPDPVETILLR